MNRAVDFFFDFMSPYSYLASTRVEPIAARAKATVRWRPAYLPGILRASGNVAPASVLPKAAYIVRDVERWAKHLDLPPVKYPAVFPFNSALANRSALVVSQLGAPFVPYCKALFRALWQDGQDGASADVLAAVLKGQELDAGAVLLEANGEAARAALKENTDEASARGAFGVPSFFVGEELFVGNDRLDFVERALAALPE